MDRAQIEARIIEKLSLFTGRPESLITADMSFVRLGMDSAMAFALCGELEDWLSIEVEPTIFREYKTISTLALRLAQTSSHLTNQK